MSRRGLLLGLAGLTVAGAAGAWRLHGPAAEVADAAAAVDAYRNGLTPTGWPVLAVEGTVLVKAAGRSFRLRPGPTATVLADFVTRFDRSVERIGPGRPDDWSYARRPVRGAQLVWSEHAAGTAVDLNALAHPQGRSGSFSRSRQRALATLLDRYDGVISWGGRFPNPDEMHFQIGVPPGAKRLTRLADRLAR